MDKRRTITYVLFSLFLIIVGALLYYTFQRRNYKRDLIASIGNLPDIKFLNIQNNKMYNLKDNIGYRPLCIVQIDPDCYFCNEQVKDMLDNYNNIDDVSIDFVSFVSPEKLNAYQKELDLFRYPNIRLLYDKDLLFPKTFGTATTPTTLIYDKQGKMLAKYDGFIKVEKIIEHLNNTIVK